jgi:hypothetical protein
VLRDHLPSSVPDGTLGILAAIIVVGAGAALAIAAGVDSTTAVVIGVVAIIVASVVIKIRADVVTSRAVSAVARGQLEPAAAPAYVQARLASSRHRSGLGKALRRIAGDAARNPRRRMVSPPPLVLHFQPETRDRIRHLAEVLETSGPLPPRGVAMAEQLITDPASPLFGESDAEVEVEVRSVLSTLGSD